jgi:hypothetical protein
VFGVLPTNEGDSISPRLQSRSVQSSSASASAASAAAAASSSSASSSSTYYHKEDPACFTSFDEPENSAVRLLHNFVAADEGSELRQRFKGITRLMNPESAGLGMATKKLINMYNGQRGQRTRSEEGTGSILPEKRRADRMEGCVDSFSPLCSCLLVVVCPGTPFLIRTCSVFWKGENYFEVDVDVHRFSYTARVGLGGVRERIKDCVFDFGFVIEGHSDFELPENMLGAVRFSHLDLSLAKLFPA